MNKYKHKHTHYWLVLFLSVFLFLLSYFLSSNFYTSLFWNHTKNSEMFSNINNNVILLGDSVLNNAKYVQKDETVYSKIKQKIDNVHLFAEDGSTLMDAYQQLDKIPVSLNNQNSFIFISVGGNNILNPLFKNTDKTVDELFEKYMTFLSSLKIKMDKF